MTTTQIKVEQIKSTGQSVGDLMQADGSDGVEWFSPSLLAAAFIEYVVTYESEAVIHNGELVWLI